MLEPNAPKKTCAEAVSRLKASMAQTYKAHVVGTAARLRVLVAVGKLQGFAHGWVSGHE